MLPPTLVENLLACNVAKIADAGAVCLPVWNVQASFFCSIKDVLTGRAWEGGLLALGALHLHVSKAVTTITT